MASMLEGVQEFLTPTFLSRVSTQTGESEAAVSKGFTAVMPTLLASLASRSGDSGFMSQLMNLASNTSSDPDALARAPKPVVADANLESSTGGWLSGLTGGSVSSVTNAIARYSGVRASSATSLLSFGVPVVLGYISRLMRSDHIDGPQLAQRLQSERGSFAAALPAGFDAFLPGSWSTSRARVAEEGTWRQNAAPAVAYERKRSMGWLLPLALLAILGGLLWWAARDRSVPAGINTAITDSARTLTRSLPGGAQITVPAGGMEDRLVAYLAAPSGPRSFDFDHLEFETNSTTLTTASHAQINTIASILKAYPQARVTIAGHTDNVGDESANLQLSRGRAEAVMAALRDAGVSASAMQAQGYGSQNPVADNSTEAGRARNRRVTLTFNG
ncbi:MAG TPA: OmpA family protein [Vicinamibacterales bacterium]|nr:OmpA family protein [Vicinamibacterales bacterium]